MLRESPASEIFKLDRTRPQSLKRPKTVLLNPGAMILLFYLVPSFHNPDFYHQSSITVNVIKVSTKHCISQHYFLACKHQAQQSVSPLISFSIPCVKKLPPVPSRNLLDFLCPAAWPFQQISGRLQSTMRPRACEHQASTSCLQKASFTFS